MGKLEPPKPDELELSLFGPGYGECVVVHLGGQRWMVVDSCLDDNKRAVALRYLKDLNVDVTSQVALVVVTHWHDDHIRGAASVVEAATSAKFVCSTALRTEEFLSLLQAGTDEVTLLNHSTGVSEFGTILEILKKRNGRDGPDQWASEGTTLYLHQDTAVEVKALSPSSATITDASKSLATLMPALQTPIRRIPDLAPNDLSVVLQISWREGSVLLGGDLETGSDLHRGWHAVVASKVHPKTKSMSYKVAHHGSETGDHPGIWTELLESNPYALLTPWGRTASPLPRPNDVMRLLSQTDQAYSTAWPPTISSKIKDKWLNKAMNLTVRNRRTIRRLPGHLRLRTPLKSRSSAVSLELFDGGTRLTQELVQADR